MSPAAAEEWGCYFMRMTEGDGISRDPTMMFGGRNSGYQAAHLAVNFGAARIGLLAYDMQRTDGRSHNHGDHRGKLRNGSNFGQWISRFGVFAEHARMHGVEVVNCSRVSALECFPRMTIQEFLA